MNAPQKNPEARQPLRLFAWYVDYAEKHTLKLLGALLVVMLIALGFAMRLELHTDLSELLPDKHPAVLALHRIAGRQKSAQNLMMIIHSSSAEANRKLAEALRPELQAMVPKTFTEVSWHADTEIPEYARKWKWMLASEQQLEDAESLIDRIVQRRSNPGFVDLEGDPDEELKKLRDSLDQKLPPPPKGQYFEKVIDGQPYLGVMLWQRLDGLATAGAHESLERVEAVVKKLNPKSFAPDMKVEYT